MYIRSDNFFHYLQYRVLSFSRFITNFNCINSKFLSDHSSKAIITHIYLWSWNFKTNIFVRFLMHSDQGSHYTSVKFIELVRDARLRRSMSRKANCWDNAPQESFFGHMKDEIDITWCTSYEEILQVITDWADYYNNDRYQWDLAKLSPREYYSYLISGEYPLVIPKANGKT